MHKSILRIATLTMALLLVGCATTSTQVVERPDVRQAIGDSETRIKLTWNKSGLGTESLEATVRANDKLIGELAVGDLMWSTKAGSMECISIAFHSMLVWPSGDAPIASKCFQTFPKSELALVYGGKGIVKQRLFRSIAFLPLYRSSRVFDENTPIRMSVKNSVPMDSDRSKQFVDLLNKAMLKQFEGNISPDSTKSIELNILEYKSGNAASRWVAPSEIGATLVKVQVTIKESNLIIEKYITRPVVSSGGLATVGADEYIFEDVAEDIFYHIYKPKN